MPKHDYSVYRFLLYKRNVLWKLLPYHYVPLKLLLNNADPHSYEAIDSNLLSHKNRRIPRTCKYHKQTLLEKTFSSFHRHFSFRPCASQSEQVKIRILGKFLKVFDQFLISIK